MKRIFLAMAVLMASIVTAGAFEIAPRCMRMNDKIGCTCAVQNGGGTFRRRDGVRSWYSVAHRKKDHVNEAFVRCQMRVRLGSSKPLPDPSLNDFSPRRSPN